MYNGQELASFVMRKIEHIVNMIAEKDGVSFDSAYAGFVESQIYRSLQNPASLLWAENAEFITDEFYREKGLGSRAI